MTLSKGEDFICALAVILLFCGLIYMFYSGMEADMARFLGGVS